MDGYLKQSTARNVVVRMIDATDNSSGVAGLTLTVTASKDGAAFASISPTQTDLGNGFYKLALTTSHTDTLGNLDVYSTGTGAYAEPSRFQVVIDLPGASVSSVTGNVAGSVASVTAAVTITAASVQAIWDALTSALTTVGSVGKRIADFLTGDAFVRLGAPVGASISADIALKAVQSTLASTIWSEPLAAYTTVGTAGYTLANAGGGSSPATIAAAVWNELKTAHTTSGTFGFLLDVAISSRAPSATALSNVDYTSGRAANLDNLDATISSRAPSATALSTAQWTNGRATNLDNLDATVSTRATQSSVNNIQNNTNFVGVVNNPLILPASGSKVYPFYVRLFNETGSPVDADSQIVNYTIKDSAGATVVASTAMTRNALGQYNASYTVLSTDIERSLFFFFDYAIATVAFNQVRVTEVQEFESKLDTLISRLTATRATNLDNLDAAISTRAPSATALSTAQWTNGRATNLDNLDATISSRAPSATALSNVDYTSGRAANLDNLNATVSSRASQATVALDATVAKEATSTAIKAKTDLLAFTSGNVHARTVVNVDKTGYALTSGEQDTIADKVWDELLTGHTTANSAGKVLSDAGGGSSPATIAAAVWNEVLTGYNIPDSAGYDLKNVSGGSSPAAIADAVWNEPKASHTTSGTFGELVDAKISTLIPPPSLTGEVSEA